MPRSDHSGWQRGQPERQVAGRRKPSAEEHERQRLAHEREMEAHQANSGGLDWLITLEKKDPKKAKQLQQTTQHPFRGSIAEIARLGVPRGYTKKS